MGGMRALLFSAALVLLAIQGGDAQPQPSRQVHGSRKPSPSRSNDTTGAPVGSASRSLLQTGGFVKAYGTRFYLDDKPFLFTGCNSYYLMEAAAAGNHAAVDEVLNDAIAKGEKVIRTWAFNDGAERWHAMQKWPGDYNEYVFQGLDYVVYKAGQLGVKLVLTFVNNWPEYGGKQRYVAWSSTAWLDDHFYSDWNCRQFYKNHVSAVINRWNTYNNMHYRDDPAIFSWELMNEPRDALDTGGATMLAWIKEMAAHVKAQDANHMLTVGLEGFYGPNSPNSWSNPGSWATKMGSDFISHHAVEGIDYATHHVYPHHFLGENAPWSVWFNFYVNFITAHHEDGDVLDMPVVLAEFGVPNWVPWQRQQLFAKAYELMYDSAKSGGAAAGGMYWVAFHDGSPNHGLWGVYYPGSTDIIPMIQAHAADMDALAQFEYEQMVTGQSGGGGGETEPPPSQGDGGDDDDNDGSSDTGKLHLLTPEAQVAAGFEDASWVYDNACAVCGYEFSHEDMLVHISTGAWGAFSVQIDGDQAQVQSFNDLDASGLVVELCTSSSLNLVRLGLYAVAGSTWEQPLSQLGPVSIGNSCYRVSVSFASDVGTGQEFYRMHLKDQSGQGFVAELVDLYLQVPGDDAIPGDSDNDGGAPGDDDMEQMYPPPSLAPPPPQSSTSSPPPPVPTVSGQDGDDKGNDDDPEVDGDVVELLTDGDIAFGFEDASWVGTCPASNCGYDFGVSGTHVLASTGNWGAFSLRLDDTASEFASFDEIPNAHFLVATICTDADLSKIRFGMFATDNTEESLVFGDLLTEAKDGCYAASIDLSNFTQRKYNRVFIKDFTGSGSTFEVFGLYLQTTATSPDDDGSSAGDAAEVPPPHWGAPPPISDGTWSCQGVLSGAVLNAVCNGCNPMCGTAQSDVIYGTAGCDCIFGFQGDDTLYGMQGDDVLIGGNGDDVLYGGDGSDTLYGDLGYDMLDGGAASDSLFGGQQSDTLYGGEGNDVLAGNQQGDVLYGEEGNDLLLGKLGNDSLFGGEGDDTLQGGAGQDVEVQGGRRLLAREAEAEADADADASGKAFDSHRRSFKNKGPQYATEDPELARIVERSERFTRSRV